MCKNYIKENPLPHFFLSSSSFPPNCSSKEQMKSWIQLGSRWSVQHRPYSYSNSLLQFDAAGNLRRSYHLFATKQRVWLRLHLLPVKRATFSHPSPFTPRILILWRSCSPSCEKICTSPDVCANTRCVNGRQTYPPSISTVNEREMDLTEMCSLLRNKKLQQTSITIRRHRTNQIIK